MFVRGGLRYDIDFTGGTLVEVRLAQPASIGTIRSRLAVAGLGDSIIQVFDNPRDVLVRTHLGQTNAAEVSRRIIGALAPDGAGAPEIRRVELVGPQIGRELQKQAVYAVLAALGGILVYVWMRFDFRGGVVTILSLGHDVLICLGALSLANREFSLPVLAALLTVIGFSVNDRIVIYDRLREIQSKGVKGITFAQQVNLAVNQTLSRTVLTVGPGRRLVDLGRPSPRGPPRTRWTRARATCDGRRILRLLEGRPTRIGVVDGADEHLPAANGLGAILTRFAIVFAAS